MLWLSLSSRCAGGEQDRPGWQASGGCGPGPGVGTGPRPGMFWNIRGKYRRLRHRPVCSGALAGSSFFTWLCMHWVVTPPYVEPDLLHPLPEISSQYSKSHSCVTMKRISQPALGKAGSQLVRNTSVWCSVTVLSDVCRRHGYGVVGTLLYRPLESVPWSRSWPTLPTSDGVTWLAQGHVPHKGLRQDWDPRLLVPLTAPSRHLAAAAEWLQATGALRKWDRVVCSQHFQYTISWFWRVHSVTWSPSCVGSSEFPASLQPGCRHVTQATPVGCTLVRRWQGIKWTLPPAGATQKHPLQSQ